MHPRKMNNLVKVIGGMVSFKIEKNKEEVSNRNRRTLRCSCVSD